VAAQCKRCSATQDAVQFEYNYVDANCYYLAACVRSAFGGLPFTRS
jgi:hypothetical protein